MDFRVIYYKKTSINACMKNEKKNVWMYSCLKLNVSEYHIYFQDNVEKKIREKIT